MFRPLRFSLSSLKNQWKGMSMWPPGFVDPIIHKHDFPELKETGDFRMKTLNPVKAAPSIATCSLFKDPLIEKFHRLVRKHNNAERANFELLKVYRIIKHTQLKKYYNAPEERKKLIVTDPTELIKIAIDNARPLMGLETVKVGAVEYTVPAPITKNYSEFQSMKWILNAARDRDKSKSFFHEKLAEIILETASFTGRVIQCKNEHHKTCEINRAYAHYRKSR